MASPRDAAALAARGPRDSTAIARGPRPETTLGYWERKNDEVALLREYLELGPGPALVTVPDLVHEKLVLRARMLARFIEDHPLLTESNLGGDYAMDLDGASVGFSYQRYDMRVRRKPFAPWIYPALASRRWCSLGALTASGMSAVTAVLTALDLLHEKPRPLYLAPGTYFETGQFAANYLYQLRVEETLPEVVSYCGVLLLDSIARDDPLPWIGSRPLGTLCAVVVDTTCYDVSAPEIGRVVERCRAESVPCLLVRSHLKLDTLGLEYGRMGSIAMVLPRPCPEARARFAKHLRRRIHDYLVKTGTGLSIPSYFPLSSHPRFRWFNDRRNAIMRENNLRAAATLAEIVHPRATARVTPFHHGRFFYLQLPIGPRPGHEGRELAGALLESCVSARTAPSFGYDFVGITRMVDPKDRQSCLLRVSLPDYASDMIEPAVEAIARFAIERTRR